MIVIICVDVAWVLPSILHFILHDHIACYWLRDAFAMDALVIRSHMKILKNDIHE